ncbi:MAG: GNAT family N-acetyltransferase [Thermodesulfovibrionales bacterium]|nr:GNAT family N-acetyltransferase [Thermodesulfovibrionales bacterium]
MIKELSWDSNFFGRKIGELIISEKFTFSSIKKEIKRAEEKGFDYLICRLSSFDIALISTLTMSGFYLSDIGITWVTDTRTFKFSGDPAKDRVLKAEEKDIPGLKKIAKGLFKESRFYRDPFFKKKEADKFFETWIVNSVKGISADIVLWIPKKGFISCKKEKDTGRIVLVGVARGFQGKGLGKALVEKALRWFKDEDIFTVKVRTQLNNINAMNFYNSMNFKIETCDFVLSKIV